MTKLVHGVKVTHVGLVERLEGAELIVDYYLRKLALNHTAWAICVLMHGVRGAEPGKTFALAIDLLLSANAKVIVQHQEI